MTKGRGTSRRSCRCATSAGCGVSNTHRYGHISVTCAFVRSSPALLETGGALECVAKTATQHCALIRGQAGVGEEAERETQAQNRQIGQYKRINKSRHGTFLLTGVLPGRHTLPSCSGAVSGGDGGRTTNCLHSLLLKRSSFVNMCARLRLRVLLWRNGNSQRVWSRFFLV
jgi:hypothetical protein